MNFRSYTIGQKYFSFFAVDNIRLMSESQVKNLFLSGFSLTVNGLIQISQ